MLDEANSNYNGPSTKLTQRFSRGVMYMVSCTWSKAIDTGSAARTSSGDTTTQDQYHRASNRGLSAYNVGRRLAASVLYDLPVGSGKAFLNHGGIVNAIIGGWQLGRMVTLADGSPTGPSSIPWSGGDNFSNNVDATGTSPIPANRSMYQSYNAQAFNWTDPGLQYRRGNIARNVLIGPGTESWDFSTAKSFRIMEGHALQFRFEGFNIANQPNWNLPNSDLRSPLFGLIQTAKTMRQLQFALKYSF